MSLGNSHVFSSETLVAGMETLEMQQVKQEDAEDTRRELEDPGHTNCLWGFNLIHVFLYVLGLTLTISHTSCNLLKSGLNEFRMDSHHPKLFPVALSCPKGFGNIYSLPCLLFPSQTQLVLPGLVGKEGINGNQDIRDHPGQDYQKGSC